MSRKRGVVQDRGKPMPTRPESLVGSKTESTEGKPSSQRGTHLMIFLCGLLLGIAFHFTDNTIKSWFPPEDSLTAQNSLLVSQQLDQLFRNIDDGVAAAPERFEAYTSLLQTFYVYDRRFVEQNEGSNLTASETASAEQRLGLCARVFGNFEASKSHYRKARTSLDNAIKAEPHSIALLQNLLEVQTTLAQLEQASGKTEAGRNEFEAALQLLSQSKLNDSLETHEWLAPQYRTLASLAMQLGRYQDALDLANRHIKSMQVLASAYPTNDQLRKDADEAKVLLDQVNEKLQPTES